MSTIAAGLTSTNALVNTGDTSGQLVFQTNGTTTAMTIDTSQNVGIGTSSPTTKLNVGGAYATGYNSTLSQFVGANVVQANGAGMVSISTNNATGADLGGSLNFGSYDSNISSPYPCAVISGRRESGTAGTYSGYFAVATTLSNGTIAERMRIDSSGNVGLGGTPNSWGSSFKVLQNNGATGVLNFSGSNVSGIVSTNAYNNGTSWLYQTAGPATRADYNYSTSGAWAWNIAGTGTAGNAISFTQAMTLDASGNLAVGGYAAGNTVKVQNNVGGYATLGITSNADSLGYLDATNLFLFRVNATERMRIDSFGNLLVGTTSAIGKLTVNKTSSDWAASIQGANGSSVVLIGNQSGTAYYNAIIFTNNGVNTSVGSVSCNGSSTSFNTSSDYRLKENIAPMVGALDKVSQLKPVTYTWKADGSDGQGFIAHELQAIVPDCVTGEKDAVDEEGKPVYQGIDTSFLVATLTKAIQEQQAIINELKSRIETLENK